MNLSSFTANIPLTAFTKKLTEILNKDPDKKVEKLSDSDTTADDSTKAQCVSPCESPMNIWIILSILVIFGIPAAILSWKTNTEINHHVVVKVISSIGAFFSSPQYFLYYLIFRLDVLLKFRECIGGSPKL